MGFGGVVAVFRGTVATPGDVDWARTGFVNLTMPDEQEITLREGVPVHINGWKRRGKTVWETPPDNMRTVTASKVAAECKGTRGAIAQQGIIAPDGMFWAGDKEGTGIHRGHRVPLEHAEVIRKFNLAGRYGLPPPVFGDASRLMDGFLARGAIRVSFISRRNAVLVEAYAPDEQTKGLIWDALTERMQGVETAIVEFSQLKGGGQLYSGEMAVPDILTWLENSRRGMLQVAIVSGPGDAGHGRAGDTLPGPLFRASYAPGGAIVGAAGRRKPVTQYEARPFLAEHDFSSLLANGGWVTNQGVPIAMRDPTDSHGQTALDEGLCGYDPSEVDEENPDYLGDAENAALENGHLRVDRDFGQLSVQAHELQRSRRLITETFRMMPFKGDVFIETGPHDHPTWQKNFHSSEDAAEWLENL